MMWQNLADPQVLQALGERVRALRLDRELSQAELAQHAGLSLPTLQRLEAGRGGVGVERLVRVLRSLRRLDALAAALAPPPVSPIALAAERVHQRVRAPRRSK